LAELEICDGKISVAKERLDEILSVIHEGFNTKDYKKAKELSEKIAVSI
jgi:hypothetical protein